MKDVHGGSGVDARALRHFLRVLLNLRRGQKRLIMLAADAVAIPLVMWAAIALGRGAFPPVTDSLAKSLLLAAAICIPIFVRVGLYRAVVRFMGPRAAFAISIGVVLAVLGILALVLTGVVVEVSISGTIVFGALLLCYVGASRMIMRWLATSDGRRSRVRVIIYGAGRGGVELAVSLQASSEFLPVAFVDDNSALGGTVVAGIPVHRSSELPLLVDRKSARRVLLAIPSLTRRRRRAILAQLEPLGVHVQTIPNIADIVAGTARVSDVQDVDVADLLGRDPVAPNQTLLDACIRSKTVMVTGAGGSIGSELCRQIILLKPNRLLLLEMSELALYSIERELRHLADDSGVNVELVPLLGNAHHKYRVREILQSFAVQTVYHAAAYKHVPIVEQNIIEGLHNNVFSTWHTAEAAFECRVETFVLISTDKAVNPSNVMGATKRFAEIVLQGLHQRDSGTRFCMVRFGNVLESSGSVVPLFRDQIRRGGPVTVTHPEVFRYFMTIPEAAQLVIQAGSMGSGGDVFVLDMGKPVRIVDLARRMIQLAGLSVRDEGNIDGDIEIQYTGLRPAEKLFEELLIGKNVAGTEHPMIMRAIEPALPWEEVQGLLDEMTLAMRRYDCLSARKILERAVKEYVPKFDIQDIIWTRRAHSAPPVIPALPAVSVAPAAAEATVTDLQARRAGRAMLPVGNSTRAD